MRRYDAVTDLRRRSYRGRSERFQAYDDGAPRRLRAAILSRRIRASRGYGSQWLGSRSCVEIIWLTFNLYIHFHYACADLGKPQVEASRLTLTLGSSPRSTEGGAHRLVTKLNI